MHKIQVKSLLIVLSVALIMSMSLIYICFSSMKKSFQAAEDDEMHRVATLVVADLQSQAEKAASRASFFSSWPSVIEAYKLQDRDLLYRSVWPALEQQRDEFGVREAQFLTPPVISFLRVYAPLEGHGEDLSDDREMLLTAHQTGFPQEGIEIGRRGLSIRGVDLIKDEAGNYLGILEIGMSFTTVLDDLKNNTGFDSAVFVEAELMSKIATLVPRPCIGDFVGKYQSVESNNWDLVRQFADPNEFRTATATVYTALASGGKQYGTVLIPMNDYKGKQIGFILAVKNFGSGEKIMHHNVGLMLFVCVLHLLAIGGALYFVLRMYILEPIGHLKEQVGKRADGEKEVPLEDPLQKDNEFVNDLVDHIKKMKD